MDLRFWDTNLLEPHNTPRATVAVFLSSGGAYASVWILACPSNDTIEMFLQVKSRTFSSKMKSFDFDSPVKSTKVKRHSLFQSSQLQMRCMACVNPVAKRDDKVIFWWFFLSFFSWFWCFVFYLLIFEMTGPNLMKNRPCQKPLPSSRIMIICIFRLF